jgi:hypothetical protein
LRWVIRKPISGEWLMTGMITGVKMAFIIKIGCWNEV